jgi:hypothetical protein
MKKDQLIIGIQVLIAFLLIITCTSCHTKSVESAILKELNGINTDSLAVFRLEKNENGFKAFIDNKFYNIDYWPDEIKKACSKRKNDSVFVLEINNSIPISLRDEVLRIALDINKKTIIKIK